MAASAPDGFDAFSASTPPKPRRRTAWYADNSIKCTAIVGVLSMLMCIFGHGSVFGLQVLVVLAFFGAVLALIGGSVLIGVTQLFRYRVFDPPLSNLLTLWKWGGPLAIVLFLSFGAGEKVHSHREASAMAWLKDQAPTLEQYRRDHGAYPTQLRGVIDLADAPTLVRGSDFHYFSDGTRFSFDIYTSFDSSWHFSSDSPVWEHS